MDRAVASKIGVRSAWTCALCGAVEQVYQFVDARDPVLAVPEGWEISKGRTICGGHPRVLRAHFDFGFLRACGIRA